MTNADPLNRAVLPDVLSVDDLSRHLGLSRRTCRELCASGRIPAVKFAGRWYCDRLAFRDALRPDAPPPPLRLVAEVAP